MSCETVREALSTASITEIEAILVDHDCADCRALADRIVAQDRALHQAVEVWTSQGPPERRRVPWPWIVLALATAATVFVIVRSLWAPVEGVHPARPFPIPPAPESEQLEPTRSEAAPVERTRMPTSTATPRPAPRPSPRPAPAPRPR